MNYFLIIPYRYPIGENSINKIVFFFEKGTKIMYFVLLQNKGTEAGREKILTSILFYTDFFSLLWGLFWKCKIELINKLR
jgi:hypothetical protein